MQGLFKGNSSSPWKKFPNEANQIFFSPQIYFWVQWKPSVLLLKLSRSELGGNEDNFLWKLIIDGG